jgi:hypothetical protein
MLAFLSFEFRLSHPPHLIIAKYFISPNPLQLGCKVSLGHGKSIFTTERSEQSKGLAPHFDGHGFPIGYPCGNFAEVVPQIGNVGDFHETRKNHIDPFVYCFSLGSTSKHAPGHGSRLTRS